MYIYSIVYSIIINSRVVFIIKISAKLGLTRVYSISIDRRVELIIISAEFELPEELMHKVDVLHEQVPLYIHIYCIGLTRYIHMPIYISLYIHTYIHI